MNIIKVRNFTSKVIGFTGGVICPLGVLTIVGIETYFQVEKEAKEEIKRMNDEREKRIENDVKNFINTITK